MMRPNPALERAGTWPAHSRALVGAREFGNWGQRTILLTELGSNCELREILVGVSSEVLPMARAPRITIPTYPHHIIQRGNNRQAIFFGEDDYRFFVFDRRS